MTIWDVITAWFWWNIGAPVLFIAGGILLFLVWSIAYFYCKEVRAKLRSRAK
jgi:hypothetical protein